MIGVGAGDVRRAVRAGVARILKETKGDELAESKLLIEMLRERGLLSDRDVEVVSRLSEIGHETSAGKRDAGEACFRSLELYNEMLPRGRSSALALALASGSVGSYTVMDDADRSGGVVYAAKKTTWEDPATSDRSERLSALCRPRRRGHRGRDRGRRRGGPR